MVSSKVMLVNRGSKSKLPIKKSGFWLMISSGKWREPFTVNSLVVKGLKIGTKNSAGLQVEVFEADKIGRNGRQLSILVSFILHEPYIAPGLLLTGFSNLLFFSIILLEVFWGTYQRVFLVWQQILTHFLYVLNSYDRVNLIRFLNDQAFTFREVLSLQN